jgi:hypothetical protein
MTATLTTLDNILKEDYLGPIREQVYSSHILLSRLEKNEEDVGGQQATVPLHTARNSGVGARADGGALPSAGNQSYAQAVYNCAYNYGRIQVSGPVIKASKKNKYAFVRAIESEIKGMVKDLKDDLNRQLHGDGSGVLGLVNGDPATGTTLTMDNPGTQYINKGMILNIVDDSSTTAGDSRANVGDKIVGSKTSATACEVTEAFHADAADDDYVVRKGSYALEMMGLLGIVNNSNPRAGLYVGAINRSTAGNEYWDASVDSNSGTLRPLTLDLMQTSWDAAEEEGGEISLVLTTRAVRRKYLRLVRADGRFVNTMTLDGGFDALEYNGKPLAVDRHCMPNRIYFLDESTLALYRMSDLDWMDEDGAILSRVTGYDAYEAVLYFYATLGCGACNKNALLSDIEI